MYTLTECNKNGITVYGIACGTVCVKNISVSKEELQLLVDKLNKCELSPIHLNDVIQDFIN